MVSSHQSLFPQGKYDCKSPETRPRRLPTRSSPSSSELPAPGPGPSMILEGSSGTVSDVQLVEVESRSKVCGSLHVGLPQPMVRLPTLATAPNEQRGIPPPVAEEAGGRQFQLVPPRFLPLGFCLPLPRPGVLGKDCWESLPEDATEVGAATCTDDFCALD